MNSQSKTLSIPRWISAIGLLALSLGALACGDPGTTSDLPNEPDSRNPTSRDPANPDPRDPSDPVGPFGVLHSAAPVAGVQYETDSHEGVTDEKGRFFYEPGERVSFYIGTTSLGEVDAQDLVTPFELVPGAEVVTGTGPIRRALEKPAFQRVLSIAMFIESLDVDGDWTNGLEIPEELTTMLAGVEIDLFQAPRDLQSSFAMRKLLVDATDIPGEPRAVVSAATAATHLYQGLGIDPQISQPVRSELDRDVDGTVDGTSTMVYDADGYLVRYEHDIANFGRDGSPDRIDTLEYDANGNPTSHSLIKGDVEWVTRWTYGPHGEKTSFVEAEVGYGTTEAARWEHDEYGNIVLMERDDDGDGSPNASEAYAYDDAGRLTRFEQISSAGETIGVNVREYDEAGRLVVLLSIDRDGKAWRVQSLTYDDAGRKVREEVEYTGEVNPDRTVTFEYDEEGRLTHEERDDGNDGTPDFWWIRRYDDMGHLVQEQVYDRSLGRRVALTFRSYDTQGRLVRIDRASDVNGLESTQRFEYDAAGNRIRYEWDKDGDGIADRVEAAKYDEQGNELEFERWTNEPGLDSHKYTRTFAPTGWGYLMTEAGMSLHGFRVEYF